MSIACEVIDSLPGHVGMIAGDLRIGDLNEIAATGLPPRTVLWRSYRLSHIRRSFIVDGRIAAIGGCSGSLLSPVGHPWLMTAPEVERVPLTFVKEARREMENLLRIHTILQNFVAARYTRAVNFLALLGFSIGDESSGMRVGPSRELFLKFEMGRG